MKKILKFLKWFYPGLRIKRWLFLSLSGIIILLIASQIRADFKIAKVLRIVFFILGGVFVIWGIGYFIKSFIDAIYPHKKREIIDILYENRFLSKGPKITVIGGGTGLSTVLEGLKEFTSNITAIVTVADEGGSSGRLREEFGILPPGDIRNCLVSLAEAPQLMRDLFQYRFKDGNGIKGHSFGNLFITAMTQVSGSFEDAIRESSEVLAIRGRVIPSTLEKIRLQAEYCDGSFKEGEDKIPQVGKYIERISLIPSNPKPNLEAISAIEDADIIVLGPGSLFTSVIPNLLIDEISESIRKRDVLKIYVCNVMTQSGETDGFTASDHVKILIRHTGKNIVNCCVVNSGKLSSELLVKYAKDKSFPVVVDRDDIESMGIVVFEGDLVSRKNYLHHDPHKIAKKIIEIYGLWKGGKWSRLRKKL